MIRELGENGVTVLLSSHILAEVQQVCHSVSIIGSGPAARLRRGRGPRRRAERQAGAGRRSRTRRPRSGSSRPRRFRVTRDGDRLLVEGADRAEHITRVLAERQIYVRELTPVRADLESVFLQLTQDASLHATGPDRPATATATAPTDGGAA